MKRRTISLSLIAVLSILTIFFSAEKAFAQYDSIPWDGLDRTYLLHLPEGYTGDMELPLVIAMHGGVGNAFNIENQSGFSLEADEENFIVVYPEGALNLINIRTWNAGYCCAYAANNNIDDVGFINALIDHLIGELAIDENLIYATGMSNGGMMAYRLACELSDRIAAIGPVACTMVAEECGPNRPVPVIQFHSYLDENIPYQGGIGNGLSSHYNPPLDSVMTVWSEKNECVNMAFTEVENDEYTFTRSSDCACLSEVHLYLTTDGGHSWPGGDATIIGDPPSEYIDATGVMWDFFSSYSLECNAANGLVDVDRSGSVIIYPNPSIGIFNVKVAENDKLLNLHLFGSDGVLISTIGRKNQVDLSQLPMGIYLLKVTTTKGAYYKRLSNQK